MPGDRALVFESPFARDSTPIEETAYSDDQDLIDRWASLAVLGGLAIGASLLVLVPILSHGVVPSGISIAAIGCLELFFGVFLIYVVYPPVLWATALGSGLTVALGLLLALGGGMHAWLVGTAYLAMGASLATVGTLRSVHAWRIASQAA